jgi:segregation and condensation protein B
MMTDTMQASTVNDPGADPPSPPEGHAEAAPEADAAGGELGRGNAPTPPTAVVEALLFASDGPLPGNRIAQVLGIGTAVDVRKHVEALNRRYEETGSAYRIESIANGYQMFTLPEFHPWLAKLHKARAETRLSQAALETIAVIAYRQPVMRADIEAIRGVAVGDILVRLREMRLIKIVGRAEEVGRPLLYGTTPRFLEVFGLAKLTDLPPIEEGGERIPKLKVLSDEAESREGNDASGGPAALTPS